MAYDSFSEGIRIVSENFPALKRVIDNNLLDTYLEIDSNSTSSVLFNNQFSSNNWFITKYKSYRNITDE